MPNDSLTEIDPRRDHTFPANSHVIIPLMGCNVLLSSSFCRFFRLFERNQQRRMIAMIIARSSNRTPIDIAAIVPGSKGVVFVVFVMAATQVYVLKVY